jgi:hypothetical protein
MTVDLFFANDTDYEHAAGVLTGEAIAGTYHIDPACVRLYRVPTLRLIKVSFPRPVVQGSFGDRGIHSGQHYVLLEDLPISKKQES